MRAISDEGLDALACLVEAVRNADEASYASALRVLAREDRHALVSASVTLLDFALRDKFSAELLPDIVQVRSLAHRAVRSYGSQHPAVDVDVATSLIEFALGRQERPPVTDRAHIIEVAAVVTARILTMHHDEAGTRLRELLEEIARP
jgi:hypothetical protein